MTLMAVILQPANRITRTMPVQNNASRLRSFLNGSKRVGSLNVNGSVPSIVVNSSASELVTAPPSTKSARPCRWRTVSAV